MTLQSREKTGRNDPCLCGSGKKYKHCCLRVGSTSDDSPWRRQREASDRLTEEMHNFARRKFADDIHEAWLDFNQIEFPVPFEKDAAEGQIFLPYFLFEWDHERPSPPSRNRPRAGHVAPSYLVHAACA